MIGNVETRFGLTLAFAPVRSPEGNGKSEAVVKTLKRGYARSTLPPAAETTLCLILKWIEDDNESHPRSGLRFRSARAFRQNAASA